MAQAASVNGHRHALTSLADWEALDDRPIVDVPVPELLTPAQKAAGKEPPLVFMQSMTEGERERFGIRKYADEPYEPDQARRIENDRRMTWAEYKQGERTDLVAATICTERGDRIAGLAEALAQRHPKIIDRLFQRALEVNGFIEAPEPAVEELAKNSLGGPSAVSSSASPSPSESPTPTGSTD